MKKVVLGEEDLKPNPNEMVDTLIGGALNSLRNAFSMTPDNLLSSAINSLEKWLEEKKNNGR